MLAAGDLDRRIELQRRVVVTNRLNEEVSSWVTFRHCWAERLPVSDGERAQADQTVAVVADRWRIRWAEAVRGLGGDCRLIYGAEVHEVVGVKELGRRIGLEISTTSLGEEPETTEGAA